MIRRQNAWLWSLIAGCTVLVSCGNSQRAEPALEVQAGIFFGGQLQHRMSWPLVLDPARQTQGFRLRFGKPLSQPAHLAWQLTRPRLDNKRHVSLVSSSNETTLQAGSQQHDQLITLDERDRVGKYKLRVLVDDVRVFDQPIDVIAYSPSPSDD